MDSIYTKAIYKGYKMTNPNTLTLRSYKMTHDNGFAPNISGDILSIATCKPQIRRVCKIGEWIAGFSSQKLDNSQVGQEKLIYLAKVSERISFAEFWDRFAQKRPENDKNGDNIYKPKGKDGYEQIPNPHHNELHRADDLSVDSVLLCDEFYYFGKGRGLDLPSNLRENLCIPQAQAGYGVITNDDKSVQMLIDFVRSDKDKCARFKDNNGNLGGNGIAQNGSASGSRGGANQSSKTSKC